MDANLSWNDEGRLSFKVYKKLSFQTKYMSKSNNHFLLHKTSIPHGVQIHLAMLTPRTEENRDTSSLAPNPRELGKVLGKHEHRKEVVAEQKRE